MRKILGWLIIVGVGGMLAWAPQYIRNTSSTAGTATISDNLTVSGSVSATGDITTEGANGIVIKKASAQINFQDADGTGRFIIYKDATDGDFIIRDAGSADFVKIYNGAGKVYSADSSSTTFYNSVVSPMESDTEANLKARKSLIAYTQFADTTNNQVVITTGTAVNSWALPSNFTSYPTGW